MKYIINYTYEPSYENKFFASTEINGKIEYACGHSFAEAKIDLVKKIKFLEEAGENIQIPPAEEIEISGSDVQCLHCGYVGNPEWIQQRHCCDETHEMDKEAVMN